MVHCYSGASVRYCTVTYIGQARFYKVTETHDLCLTGHPVGSRPRGRLRRRERGSRASGSRSPPRPPGPRPRPPGTDYSLSTKDNIKVDGML